MQGIHTLVPPLAMIAAILRRTPFLLTFHTGGNSSAFRERARRTQFRILSPLLRRARTLIGVSVFEARRFEEVMGLPEGAITVIRNGGSLPPVRAAVDARARAGRERGPDRALQGPPQGDRGAAVPAQDPARGPASRSWAPAPTRPSCCALADELGVADRVSIRFIPPVDRALMGETHRPGRR